MITETYTVTHTKFTDGQGNHFRVLAKYNPNEEHDLWVEYENMKTAQKYSCRLEAFLARFMVVPEDR